MAHPREDGTGVPDQDDGLRFTGAGEMSPLVQRLADRLRRDILVGRLKPGAPVKERDTADELGVSRTPMREAIRALAKEGLLTLRPARSPVVADPTLKQVIDDLTVLVALETLSVELACRNATEADLAVIETIRQRIEHSYATLHPADLFGIDMAFHKAIARASHNASLAETHAAYLARLWRARYLSASQRRNRERVLGQHQAIMDGLRARDVAATRAAIEDHLAPLASHISEVYDDPHARASHVLAPTDDV